MLKIWYETFWGLKGKQTRYQNRRVEKKGSGLIPEIDTFGIDSSANDHMIAFLEMQRLKKPKIDQGVFLKTIVVVKGNHKWGLSWKPTEGCRNRWE